MNVSFGSTAGSKSGYSPTKAAGSATRTPSNDKDKVDECFSPMSDPTLSGCSTKDKSLLATPTCSNKKISSVKKILGKLSSPFRSPPSPSASASSSIDLVDKKLQEHGHDPTKLSMLEKMKIYLEHESADTVPDLVQQYQSDLLHHGVVVRDVTGKEGNDSCNNSLFSVFSFENMTVSKRELCSGIFDPAATLFDDSAGESLPSDVDSLCSIGSSNAATIHEQATTASVKTDIAVIHRDRVRPSPGDDRDEVLNWIVDFSKV